MTASAVDQRIRSLRPPKAAVDPQVAQGSLVEPERRPNGRIEQTLTVFLTGAECPFTCSFCDLWRFTVDGPTPPGALPQQLERVLETVDCSSIDRIKLYNASNFFDSRAVPTEDLPALARLVSNFAAVTVESHANTIGVRTLELASQIPGRLEVAIGLETIHPVALTRINKRLDLSRFDQAARFLSENDIDLRVFVLLGTPHVPVQESVQWTARTVEYAVERGAATVSIIPVRGGNGEMERLQAQGAFTSSRLTELEEALDRWLGFTNSVITADLWDVERLPACESCRPARVERLGRLNVSGIAEPKILCAECGGQ